MPALGAKRLMVMAAAPLAVGAIFVGSTGKPDLPRPPRPPEPVGDWVSFGTATANDGLVYERFQAAATGGGTCLAVEMPGERNLPTLSGVDVGSIGCWTQRAYKRFSPSRVSNVGFDVGTLKGLKFIVAFLPEEGATLRGKMRDGQRRTTTADDLRITVLAYPDTEQLQRLVFRGVDGKLIRTCKVVESKLKVGPCWRRGRAPS